MNRDAGACAAVQQLNGRFEIFSLNEAVDALAADEVIQAGIGTDLAAEFMRLKRMEWIEYSRHVSEWESQRYLEMF